MNALIVYVDHPVDPADIDAIIGGHEGDVGFVGGTGGDRASWAVESMDDLRAANSVEAWRQIADAFEPVSAISIRYSHPDVARPLVRAFADRWRVVIDDDRGRLWSGAAWARRMASEPAWNWLEDALDEDPDRSGYELHVEP